MGIEEITTRAYARGTPASTWVKLVVRELDKPDLKDSLRDSNEVISALFAFLPDPPALILNYLSFAFRKRVISSRPAFIQLLFQLETHSIPLATLSTICGILSIQSDSLENDDPIPSSLESPTPIPQPDIGTSSPRPIQTKWTLSLLLPLMRSCTETSSLAQPIVQLLGQVLGIVAPYPAPPFDVGLKVSQLMGTLPETVAVPLRKSLSGLMMDLAMSDGEVQNQGFTNPTQMQPALASIQRQEGLDDSKLNAAATDSQSLVEAMAKVRPHAVALLASQYRQTRARERLSAKVDTLQTPVPKPGMIKLLKLCWRIFDTSEDMLEILLTTVISQAMGQTPGMKWEGDYVDNLNLLHEELPVALKWWKDQPDCRLPYPTNLPQALKTAFQANETALDAQLDWSLALRVSLGAIEDGEGRTFNFPDGWNPVTLAIGICHRLADLGLMDESGVGIAMPELELRPPWTQNGEPLMQLVASGPTAHIEALALVIICTPGAARSLGHEVVQAIQAYPGAQLPEGLLVNLSSCPALLTALTAYIPASNLLALATEHLIDKPEDPSIRSEDPQGSMTRFGEGIVFIETLAAQYQLPVPALLQDARIALSWYELTAEEKGMANGWLKALFGSDGIDDETLLSTSPQNFCRLSCGILQQAISATALGHIDLDTLHSGLSYFSQPLLSWSLGGIVTWLCAETHRQGLLSAIHLNVLQTLLVSSALPDGLLRAVGPHVAGLLVPSAGLEPVFRSASIDADAIKSKLDAVGIYDLPYPVAPGMDPLASFVGQLQSIRPLELSSPTRPSALLSSLDAARRAEDDVVVVDRMILELLYPSLDPTIHGSSHSLQGMTALLLVLTSHLGVSPLLETIIHHHLPVLLDGHGASFILNNPQPLVWTAHQSLILLDDTQPELAARLVEELVDEIKYQLARPIKETRETDGPVKRQAMSRGSGRTIGSAEKRFLDMLVKALGDDLESKSRWPVLSQL